MQKLLVAMRNIVKTLVFIDTYERIGGQNVLWDRAGFAEARNFNTTACHAVRSTYET